MDAWCKTRLAAVMQTSCSRPAPLAVKQVAARGPGIEAGTADSSSPASVTQVGVAERHAFHPGRSFCMTQQC
jgi:hypothetical protein